MTNLTTLADRERLAAIINERGHNLRSGDYVSDWERNDHPFGEPKPCPFCKQPVTYTELWYNGPGSPPSYSFTCGDCGAHGPTSRGRFRGDHLGAIEDALRLWNTAHSENADG